MGSQLLQQLRARQSKPTPSAEDEGRALLAAHSSEEACWVLLELDGKLRVLDVTAYLGHHPGGAKIIHRLAGTDITRPFTDVYKHSPAAYLKCRDYEIASDISDVQKLRVAATAAAAYKARIRSLAQYLDDSD
jgi:cytochrome b involved in lipid metabolism